MEHLNRIELQGVVGTIRLNTIQGMQVANFSLATDYLSKNNAGATICETCWHNVCAWEGENICDLSQIEKGSKVRVVGRMRSSRYTGADGCEKTFYEVLASEVSTINED